MGRRRSAKTRGLPANLYERRGYFSWRDPRTSKEYGLGRDKRSAIAQAIEANHEIDQTRATRRLVDKLISGPDNSVAAFCDLYGSILTARLEAGKIARTSYNGWRQKMQHVRLAWDARRIDSITTRDVADFLSQWEDAGKLSMTAAIRSFLLDAFTAAVAKGWCPSNPVTLTKAPTPEVRRARLTLETYLKIYAAAVEHHPAWLPRAMELALITGQRREDIALLGPKNLYHDKLWVEQGKTKGRVCIPVELRLKAVGWSLSEIIERCRDNALSRYFMHHSAMTGRAKPGDKLCLETLSSSFSAARDQSGLCWREGATPPTFHEIRSLAARLYAAQGTDAQALLGHKSPNMTALYRDARGAEWIEVKTV